MAEVSNGESPVVRTSFGSVRGIRADGVSEFRGIPFAAPPVGTRRFLPPAPVERWDGVRDATQFGAAPPQVVDPLSEMLGLSFDVPIHEDCLQLNIFTPAADDARRPVMVWLHGGAFATGTGAAPLYRGHRIALRGDVVVVTLNYRVGALGFLHLAERLAGAASAPAGSGANLGLQDQIEALRFVQREIAAFGGDPGCVTVFGESAGAGSLASLLAMPGTAGLFQRAVIQSAAPDGLLSREEADARCAQLLEQLGIEEDTPDALLASLQAVPMEELLRAQRACIDAGPHRTGMFFAPVVDGASLPLAPTRAVENGAGSEIDILIGTTREEMQLYSTVPGLGDFPDAVLEQIVASRIDATEDTRERVAKEAVRVYREELVRRGKTPTQQELFFALESDLSLRVPATRLASSHARARRGSTYMYLFAWASPMANGHGGTLGACHALDLPFTFGALREKRAMEFAGSGSSRAEAAQALSFQIMDAWIAFARCGDPNHPGLPQWRRYTPADRSTMILDSPCETIDAPLERERAVWDEVAFHLPS